MKDGKIAEYERPAILEKDSESEYNKLRVTFKKKQEEEEKEDEE